MSELWASAERYEAYMGRWSRALAREFVAWLAPEPGLRWLDVGCGTGALSAAVLEGAGPEHVTGVDPSEAFVLAARRLEDPRASFKVGDAQSLPSRDSAFEVAAAGLVLNFVPAPEVALAEMLRVAVPGGTVTAYVWDYAEGMQFVRRFWDAALEVGGEGADEAARFPLGRRGALAEAFGEAGLEDVEEGALEIPTVFASFDDLWAPFLAGNAPAPAFLLSLDPERQELLRERLRASLPHAADGSIALTARAWVARGRRPAA